MLLRRFSPLLFVLIVSASAHCGRERLPAFANPPPEHVPGDAATDDSDAEAP